MIRKSLSASVAAFTWTAVVVAAAGAEPTVGGPTLKGTQRLTAPRPLDEVMVEGINRFCLTELTKARRRREVIWLKEFADRDKRSSKLRRQQLAAIIGATDTRVAGRGVDFELLATTDRSSVVARSESITVHAVRWRVLEGLSAEGLLLKPAHVQAAVIAVPDADCSPEAFCGLAGSLPPSAQLARRLAESGCLVAVPMLISRDSEFSGHPDVGYTNQPHREFVYRQAFEVGRHPIGFEVQKVLAAVDLFQQLKNELRVGIVGVGEGGLIALHAGALDSRVDAALVSGYFRDREGLWREPVYRNVWRLLTRFGDAELAGLIAPRRLVIEACKTVEVAGPPAAREGRRDSAAPGRIETCPLAAVVAEHKRAARYFQQSGADQKLTLAVSGADGRGPAGGSGALGAFLGGLGLERQPTAATRWQRLGEHPSQSGRQQRQFVEMQQFVQNLLGQSHKERNRQWAADLSSVNKWLPTRDRLRKRVHDELIGRLRLPAVPANPRSRRIVANDDCLAYEVWLDVAPHIVAGGVLLLPDGLKATDKRPVVVCQHGLEGRAQDTFSREPRPLRSYQAFAAKLCRRGFIVYAPQNPYRGRDRFRSIQRKANPLGLSLFSFIIAQHRQTLDWLATLPQVDADRIAFYGLSYGGKTAMRVPPLLDGYCLSICSGDFTDWPRTIATNSESYGYAFTGEYEIPEWNLAHVAGYAELAMLMSPRPFMVEAGHRDGGQPTELVAGEFGKVRRHYDRLKLRDRAEIEFFDGPHTIHGKGTFEFLHRHLKWP